MGETDADRIGLIWELSKYCPLLSPFQEPTDDHGSPCSLPEHPESFPVNALVPIPGTPLEKNDVSLPIAVSCSALARGVNGMIN